MKVRREELSLLPERQRGWSLMIFCAEQLCAPGGADRYLFNSSVSLFYLLSPSRAGRYYPCASPRSAC